MITTTRTLLALAVILGGLAITAPADGAVAPKTRNDCAASVANLKDRIASLEGDKAEILAALETAIKKDMACAQWLAAATIEATSADPALIGEIAFVAFSTADESMRSAIAGAIRGTSDSGASNGGSGPVSYGKSGFGDGQLLSANQSVKIDGDGIVLLDLSGLPLSMRDALGNSAYAKLGSALFSSQLFGADSALLNSAGRVFGLAAISPIAPNRPDIPPVIPPGKPEMPPGGGGNPPRPPVSPPDFFPIPEDPGPPPDLFPED